VAGLATELRGTTSLVYQGVPWTSPTVATRHHGRTGDRGHRERGERAHAGRGVAHPGGGGRGGAGPDLGSGSFCSSSMRRRRRPICGAGVRHRLPGEVSPLSRRHRMTRSGREVRTRRGRARARQRLLRARPIPTTSGRASRPRPRRGARRRRRSHGPWTRTTSAPWSSGSPHGGAGHRYRPPGDAAGRRGQHPRVIASRPCARTIERRPSIGASCRPLGRGFVGASLGRFSSFHNRWHTRGLPRRPMVER